MQRNINAHSNAPSDEDISDSLTWPMQFKDMDIAKLEKKVAKKDPVAMRMLAWFYLNGNLVGRDESRAVELYTNAAELGDARALYSLGVLHYEGAAGFKKNDENRAQGMELIAQAAEKDCGRAMHFLGLRAVDEHDYKKAEQYFLKAAKLDVTAAKTSLGWLYSSEDTGLLDPQKGLFYYKQAAMKGDVEAMTALGTGLLSAGEAEEGHEWLVKASEAGSDVAARMLGVLR